MQLIVVPGTCTTSRAELWVGALGSTQAQRQAVQLLVGNRPATLQPWANIDPVDNRVSTTVATIRGLAPNTMVDVVLQSQPGRVLARIHTMPANVGTASSPLRVLLLSCFCLTAGTAPRARGLFEFVMGKEQLRPHFKIWSGDQVYLDAPATHYATRVHTPVELRKAFLDKYIGTWWSDDGIGAALAHGSNYFSSDDHEFYNNAPTPAITARDTWSDKSPSGAAQWLAAAKSLYRAFQAATPGVAQFKVGHLSFCLADTRIDRGEPPGIFMRPADLASLRTWANELDGPGVLILGQPVFARAAGNSSLGKRFSDYTLYDFKQSLQLLDAISEAKRGVLVLTGDVHFSRVAWCRLPGGQRLTEIISSPLALVSRLAGGKWKEPPRRLDISGTRGLGVADINFDRKLEYHGDSMMMLEFFLDGATTRVRTRIWPTSPQSGTYRAEFDGTYAIDMGAVP